MKEPSAKRQRVSLACDCCRKKKVKCDGAKPTCTNCANSKAVCLYTQPVRQSKPQTRRARNVLELESRLKRIETLLENLVPNISDNKHKRSSHALASDSKDSDESDDDNSSVNSDPGSDDSFKSDGEGNVSTTLKGELDTKWLDDEYVALSSSYFVSLHKQTDVQIFNNPFAATIADPTVRFFSFGTPFSIWSQRGLQWISRKIDDPNVVPRLMTAFSEVHLAHESEGWKMVDLSTAPRRCSRKLLSLCRERLERGSNPWLCSLRSSDIENLEKREFDPRGSRCNFGELTLIYSLISLELNLYSEDPELFGKFGVNSAAEAQSLQLAYMRFALYYFNRQAYLNASISGLKGILLLMMVCFTRQCPQPIFLLTSVAVRMSQEMGLHRKESLLGLNPQEANSHKTLWWCVYVSEMDVCSKAGRPSSIREEDVSMPFPEIEKDYPPGKSGAGEYGYNHLKAFASLCVIVNRIHTKLFAANSSSLHADVIVGHVIDLDKQILKWARELPKEVQPGTKCPENPTTEFGIFLSKSWGCYLGPAHLHLSYYSSLSSIHRTLSYHPQWLYRFVRTCPLNGSSAATPGVGGGMDGVSSGASSKKQSPASSCDNSAINESGHSNCNGDAKYIDLNTVSSSDDSFESISRNITKYKEKGYQLHPSKLAASYPRVLQANLINNQCARAMAESSTQIPRHFDPQLSFTLYYPVSAFITLFVRCMACPGDKDIYQDLLLMKHIFARVQYQKHLYKITDSFLKALLEIAENYVNKVRIANESTDYNTQQKANTLVHPASTDNGRALIISGGRDVIFADIVRQRPERNLGSLSSNGQVSRNASSSSNGLSSVPSGDSANSSILSPLTAPNSTPQAEPYNSEQKNMVREYPRIDLINRNNAPVYTNPNLDGNSYPISNDIRYPSQIQPLAQVNPNDPSGPIQMTLNSQQPFVNDGFAYSDLFTDEVLAYQNIYNPLYSSSWGGETDAQITVETPSDRFIFPPPI